MLCRHWEATGDTKNAAKEPMACQVFLQRMNMGYEKEMETVIVYWGYIGIMEKENGNYHIILEESIEHCSS